MTEKEQESGKHDLGWYNVIWYAGFDTMLTEMDVTVIQDLIYMIHTDHWWCNTQHIFIYILKPQDYQMQAFLVVFVCSLLSGANLRVTLVGWRVQRLGGITWSICNKQMHCETTFETVDSCSLNSNSVVKYPSFEIQYCWSQPSGTCERGSCLSNSSKNHALACILERQHYNDHFCDLDLGSFLE